MAKKQMPATSDDDAEMTAKAAEAFSTYIAMGPSRSIRNLARILVEQGLYKNSSAAQRVLATWSVKYRWQARIAAAATARGEEVHARSREWDDTAFLRSSESFAREMAELAKQLEDVDASNLAQKLILIDAMLKMRESVRRREPRGAQANVNVNVGFEVALRDAVNAIAAEEGLDPEQVLARAERIVADHQR